jgi:uncharacterized damage-inducible protein DinB
MDPRDRHRGELIHDAWANRRALESLRAAATAEPIEGLAGPAGDRALATMAHIIGSEWLWLRRLGRPTPEMDVWPALTLSECETELRRLVVAWTLHVEILTAEELSREISYRNTKGESWANTVADVLTHVALHSSYHRGQIASDLARRGATPAYTDYIEFIRRGALRRGWPTAGS